MSVQDLFLIGVVATFATFMAVLLGVSTWVNSKK